MSTDASRSFSLKSKQNMANSVDPDETARHEPSSRSTMFVQVSVLVCRAERVKQFYLLFFFLFFFFCHHCRRLGTSKVLIFTYNVSAEATKVIRHYEESGFLEVRPFDFPQKGMCISLKVMKSC